MNRTARIAVATVGLLAAGAVFGALAGAIAVTIGLAITEGPWHALDFEVISLVAVVGGLMGAPLLPSAGWLLLRHVPLGLALLGTLAGTVVGGVLGWVIPVLGSQVQSAVLGAVLGFCFAALAMRLRYTAGRVPRKVPRPVDG